MNQDQRFALGGGGYVLYAPDYPSFQLRPGFSDRVHLYNTAYQGLYHLSFLDGGVPLSLKCTGVEFVNGAAVLTHTDGKTLTVTEERLVTTDDRCVSNIKLEVTGKEEREISVVQWTTTDVQGEAPLLEGDSFRVRRSLESPDQTPIPVEIIWSSPSSKGAKCLQAFHQVGGSDRPDFEETPWFDMGPDFPTPRAKRAMTKPSPIVPEARCYLGLFRTVTMKAGSKFEERFEANVVFKGSGINYRPRRPDPKDENNYQALMSKAPKFQCESKEIERIVNHRFQMLHLLRIPNGVGNMIAPAVCAGTGHMHEVSARHAPALVREARWLTDPTHARGLLKVFFENIRQSGLVPGWIGLTKLTNTDFFHADWGGAFEALDAMHPDRATKRAVLMGMQRYVRWLANNRDPEGSGLTDIVNQFESGQSFTRRFTVISDKSDRAEEHDEDFQLKGIDVSVYRYRLVRFLHKVADEMQEKSMANRFAAEAEDIHEVIKKRMWDDKAGIYMDIDPKTRRRTGVKAAVGFYPLGTDIPKPPQVDAMLSTLSSRKEFWAKYPVPTIAISDPYFSAEGHWKGTRIEAPWNGRTSLAVNCKIMDALTYRAERGDKKARRLLGELFKRTVTLMSGELENSEQPNSCEHYNPLTGRGSRFLGTSDFLGAAVLDQVFRLAGGFAVRFGEIQMDPVIDDMPDFKLHGIPIGNKRFNVERKGKRVKILPA